MTLHEYELRTYEDLSKELKEKTSRAVELIRLMYNRLTLVDHMSHKLAIRKIIDDHSNIRGFSFRNISRNLPLNNPTTPRRIRTEWHKSITTDSVSAGRLSNTVQQDVLDRHQFQNDKDENPSLNNNRLSNQNAESIDVIPERTTMTTIDKIARGLIFRIPKEKYEMLHIAMGDSNKFINVIFDWGCEFDHAESDVVKSRI
ncbi:MAG TPA: hypothetical protein VH796_14320 [Nitrososphaeraceae archaeon]